MTMALSGAFDLSADSNTLVYTGAAGKEAFVKLNVCARAGTRLVRVACTHDATPTDADWIEYDVPLTVGGTPLVLEGIPCAEDDRIYVHADDTDVSVVVWHNQKDVA